MSVSDIRRGSAPPSDPLTVAVSSSTSTRRATVAAVGEIDIVTADRFAAALYNALDAGPEALDIDLGGVTIIDSTGISVLMAARVRALAAGCPVSIVAVQPFVRRVLGICGLLEALNVAP
jgi:anti-anti-sigma factor